MSRGGARAARASATGSSRLPAAASTRDDDGGDGSASERQRDPERRAGTRRRATRQPRAEVVEVALEARSCRHRLLSWVRPADRQRRQAPRDARASCLLADPQPARDIGVGELVDDPHLHRPADRGESCASAAASSARSAEPGAPLDLASSTARPADARAAADRAPGAPQAAPVVARELAPRDPVQPAHRLLLAGPVKARPAVAACANTSAQMSRAICGSAVRRPGRAAAARGDARTAPEVMCGRGHRSTVAPARRL